MSTRKTIALVGCDTPDEIKDSLKARDFRVLELPSDNRLPLPVRSHADMLLFPIEKYIFTSKKYFEEAKSIFSILLDYGYQIVKCNTDIRNKYPFDIAFNMAVIGNKIFGNTKYNAKEILDFATKNFFELVNVKQGYTKCSTLVINDNAIITSDKGISDAANSFNISVLKTENAPESVVLDGYNYGFIGGASGVFKNTVYFSGNVLCHKFATEICDFCKKSGYKIDSLSEGILQDIGGIMFFPAL